MVSKTQLDTDRMRDDALLHYNVISCEKVCPISQRIMPLSTSDLYEIDLVVAGEGMHFVLDQEIPCKAGDMCVIPPGIPHGFFLTNVDGSLTIRQIRLQISSWFGGKIVVPGNPDFCYGLFNDERPIAYATLNHYSYDRLSSLFDYIECEMLEQKSGWRDMVHGYLINLFVSAGRYVNSTIKNISFVSSREWSVVSAAIAILKEEFSDSSLTLKAIAQRLFKVTQFLIQYANAYKAVGANGIVMAEPVAGLLSPMLEEEFSAPYVKKIVEAVQDDNFVVIYHNCGPNVPKMLDSILTTGSAAYHFGNAVDMLDIISNVPADTVVMGNIDPAGVLRMGTPDSVRTAVLDLLGRCSVYPNFVLSSGCDIPPLTPWENIHAFFEASNEFYGG